MKEKKKLIRLSGKILCSLKESYVSLCQVIKKTRNFARPLTNILKSLTCNNDASLPANVNSRLKMQKRGEANK